MFFTKPAIAGVAALLAAAPSTAHMVMKSPAPVFANNNEHNGGKVLDTYTGPMTGRAQFPCRDASVLQALGTEPGTPVDTWAVGSSQTVTITGGAYHGGGSCQFSLSYDQGQTFKVIKSFIGNCPIDNGDTSYDFNVPADAPSGEAVFAWTWFNKIGNREMYMNCAVVNIGSGSSKREITPEEKQKRQVAFSARPNIFVANIDGSSGCRTREGIDVVFPNPGDDVVRDTNAPGLYIDESKCPDPNNTGAGTPGPEGGSSDNSGDDGGDDSGSPDPSPTDAPTVYVPTSSSGSTVTVKPVDPTTFSESSVTSSQSASSPGGIFITTPPAGASDVETPVAGPTTPTSEVDAAPTSDTPAIPSAETTFRTSTKPAPSADTPTTTFTAPTTTTTTTVPDTGDDGGFAVGESCDSVGMWNCIDGSSFQRCVSGNKWTAILPMAAGTQCEPGMSEGFVLKHGGSRIFRA